MSSIFAKKKVVTDGNYDLESIRKGGELIIATISGPETYYDYRGLSMGLQYALASNFAGSEGVIVRVEVAKDSTALVDMLKKGEVDMIAYPLSDSYLKEQGLVPAGYSKKGSWAVRSNAKDLALALDDWYEEGMEEKVKKEEVERVKQSRHVTRHAQSVFLSRERGVISIYDNLFKEAQSVTGWDWRLIAAQCYQESAFDPNARSYVGAQGLMQIMPSTAKGLGLTPAEVWQPEKNVNAAARCIVGLTNNLKDVQDPNERLKFVLASYNGGLGHVRDAMALARKYGRNPQRWDDVAPYILGLQTPQYYRDPVVKHGYMIGSETAGYVHNILLRWQEYGGRVAITHAPQLPGASGSSNNSSSSQRTRPNRYSSGTKILSADDPSFNQMDQ